MEPISIRKILRDKNPTLARWIPRVLVTWVEHIVRLKKVNYVLQNYGDQPPMQFIDSTLRYIGVSYTLHGVENIPTTERVIFAANHPLGGLDGLILALGLSPYCAGGEKFIVNDILMNLKPLAPIFVPVNKHGRQGGDYARQHDNMYSSDLQVITFPAGLCSRLIDQKIQDPPWKATFVQKAIRYERTIIPVYIEGANSRFFYRLSRWRKRIGMRANLEMILLPKEMFDQKGKHLDIYIGQPITVDDEQTAAQWTQFIRQKAYALNPRKS